MTASNVTNAPTAVGLYSAQSQPVAAHKGGHHHHHVKASPATDAPSTGVLEAADEPTTPTASYNATGNSTASSAGSTFSALA